MRKWMVIGLVAVITAGFLAYILLEPKKGSVEYHKQEYLAAWKRLNGDTWRDRLSRNWARITGAPLKRHHDITVQSAPGQRPLSKDEEELLLNHRALVRLGYLKEYRIPLDKARPEDVVYLFHNDSRDGPFVASMEEFVNGRRVVVITGPDQTILSNIFVRMISE